MSVYLCIPSKRKPEEIEPVLRAWAERGYKIALQRDPGEEFAGPWLASRPYLGYAEAVNYLAGEVLRNDPSCDWIVAAGDDTLPDPDKTADEIAEECSEHFAVNGGDFAFCHETGRQKATFGVMQPTGDEWSDRRGKIIEQIAGSPFMGREWCLRANQGKGPLWPGFFHMWADETLQLVAQKLGVFWQRPDLCHHHEHWGRPRPGERLGQLSRMPEFLKRANSPEQTTADKKEFDRLKDDGFKVCFPL
jgi:hypothetical protein